MAGRTLYSIEEAREKLGGISRNTLYDLLRSGALASTPIGRRRFISAAAIDAFVSRTSTQSLSSSLPMNAVSRMGPAAKAR